ncbi:MAG: FAD-dependent oxidoreductase [Candidatus Manganitrophus sp. SA1]|nr:FAD-dependent oxidoreductase [Candidatus Manganitrophus morganii]
MNTLSLGIDGWSYADLYDPLRLKELAEMFYRSVEASDPDLGRSYAAYRESGGKEISPVDESNLIVALAPHLDRFVSRLFRIEPALSVEVQRAEAEKPIFDFKRDFVIKRALKAIPSSAVAEFDLKKLDRQMEILEGVIAPQVQGDRERSIAVAAVQLMEIERDLIRKAKGQQQVDAEPGRKRLAEICDLLRSDPTRRPFFEDRLPSPSALDSIPTAAETATRLLQIPEQWVALHAHRADAKARVKGWVSFRFPEKIDFMHLVEAHPIKEDLPEAIQGPEKHRRRRDGFVLTDPRFNLRQVFNEVHYCIFCHEREKDSCSKGFIEKDGKIRENPLGIPLTGCPLDEKISEAQLLKRDGATIGALATMMIDNPTIPATGHRICNDCMKGCVYQKQEPVNIPQIETRMLTDCLDLPWGFEIYNLLTRWNPLNVKRPYPLPFHGKTVLVVGMGPAGFTLAQYLLNEGFGVLGIDGLKIEPLPKEWVGDGKTAPKPIEWVSEIYESLDERIMAGFGGVAEYGITVRWDKNFLKLIYLSLVRNVHFRVYGGVRFGGTLTIDDAWRLGIDHIAVATGAGRPTIVEMKNNLIRGVRKASDFLMALQLTGAAKRSSMANLQVRLPAIVIGGGLTATDTATELMAYYPLQVEKIRERYEALRREFGDEQIWSMYDAEEKEILEEFLTHAEECRRERARAAEAREEPDFTPLVRSWGGVSILYRKSLSDSPAYRLNHEEIVKSFEEGIFFVENMSPVECVPDAHGAVKEVTFERQKKDEKGKWRGSGEIVPFPARSVFVAAGTSPNIIYEKEWPGTFQLDKKNKFFQKYEPKWNGKPGPELIQIDGWDTVATDVPSLFTSYQNEGRYITFYGDNHPIYAGNVVKAMASAKKGYPYVVKLFEKEIAAIDPAKQPARETQFKTLAQTLEESCMPRVRQVNRLTPTIVEVVVKAPLQAQKFEPGQFYRLQNYEIESPVIEGTRLSMEGIALTGAWVDKEAGLLSLIALELGHSSRLCAALRIGEPVVVMGPTGCPTHIPEGGETVVLAGGGLGNAVLFSIGKALRAKGNKVIYFAGYKNRADVFKMDDIEMASDVIVWSSDIAPATQPRRPQDKSFVGNILQAMQAYGEGKLGETAIPLRGSDRIIAIGSDRMMAAVSRARHTVLKSYFKENHTAIASINSTMQCMMKEVCAQCLQRQVDPKTGAQIEPVFTCYNQDQKMDEVDFPNLNARLKQNSVQEKLTNLWLDYLLKKKPLLRA